MRRLAYLEERAATQERRVTPQLKNQVAADFEKAGLDGNGRFEKAERGYAKALNILGAHGIEMDEVPSSHHFTQPEGRITIDLAWTNPDDSFSPTPIPNSRLALSWYKRDEDNFEVLAYLS